MNELWRHLCWQTFKNQVRVRVKVVTALVIGDLLVFVDIPKYYLLGLETYLSFPLEMMPNILEGYNCAAEFYSVISSLTFKLIVYPVVLLRCRGHMVLVVMETLNCQLIVVG